MPNADQFKNREEYNKYFRKYRERNREKMRDYNREYNRKYRKEHGYWNEINWKKKNIVKVNVNRILQNAIKSGKIKRKPCVFCGKEKTVAHHIDYRKPLKVIFLCHACHYKIHHKRKKGTS